jgi:transposase
MNQGGSPLRFCLNLVIPCGWQFPNEPVEILPTKSKRLNVLGFMNKANELLFFEHEGTINTQFVIDSISKWLVERQEKKEKMIVLVLDNAPIHCSKLFKKQIEIWQEKGLFIFLPKYSPHLNKIETLWRKTKYEWLKPEDYASFKVLKEAVIKILVVLPL